MNQQEKKAAYDRKRKEINPWVKHHNNASSRTTRGNYKKRGIKCRITTKQMKYLWFRDKAYLMEQPSLDRKNGAKDYTVRNSRFIELVDNWRRPKAKRII